MTKNKKYVTISDNKTRIREKALKRKSNSQHTLTESSRKMRGA
ncbi:hypothetical protein CLOHYLEM_07009 [[Clostridium] hylemonae DSM 15053]|uniref:Uncharacterized protein n=1 Tax=[Clostridium] hylemonae DSM 15053 TaxID=553973 RepID=C0C4J3_9FIRM|nr:hypothetical protein CLOHYLEM_07009 [[Clostridium] hylemonae DSM 15053]